MEQLMQNIIKADKEAFEIINVAKKEREHIKQRTIQEAKRDLLLRKTAQQKQMALQDTELQSAEQEKMKETYDEYIAAKHKLDEVFNMYADGWSEEIIDNVLNK